MRRLWELLGLAFGSLRRTPLRVTLTALGVAIATGALVSMVGFALGMQARIEEPFQKLELLNRIDVRPVRQAVKDKNGQQPPCPLDDAAVARIAALPGVALAYPDFRLENIQSSRSTADPGSDRGTVQRTSAIGLPAAASQLRFVSESLVAGRFLSATGTNEVVVGRKLAQSLGFDPPQEAVGQPLTLKVRGLLPGAERSFRFSERQVQVVVAGVWDPPGGRNGYTAEGLVLPVALIQELPGVQFESTFEQLLHGSPGAAGGYGRVVVRVARPADLFLVHQRIGKMGFDTQTLLAQFKEMQTAFVIMDLVLTAVGTVALVVAGLGIINTLLMAVLERYREIGTYKALGASDGDIRVLFLGEAALVGVLGGVGGLALGRVVSWLIDLVVNSAARRYGVDEPVMVFAFPLRLLGGAMLFALVVSVCSGVYPAARAARVDPIKALRTE